MLTCRWPAGPTVLSRCEAPGESSHWETGGRPGAGAHGLCSHSSFSSRTALVSLLSTDKWGQVSLSCALRDAEKHPWPPPTRSQEQPPPQG